MNKKEPTNTSIENAGHIQYIMKYISECEHKKISPKLFQNCCYTVKLN